MINCIKDLYDYDMAKKGRLCVCKIILLKSIFYFKKKRKKMAIDLSVYLVVKKIMIIIGTD